MMTRQKNSHEFLTGGTITTKATTMKVGDICYLGGGGRPLTIRRIVKRPTGGWQVTVSYLVQNVGEAFGGNTDAEDDKTDQSEVHQIRSIDANQLFTALPGDPERMPVWQVLYAQVRK
jgi:hypothetical protein